MQAKKAKALSALSVAAVAAVGFSAVSASGATLNLFYNGGGTGSGGTVDTIKYGTSSALSTAGTSVAVTPTASAVTVTIPVGDYLEFGLSANVSNNANPIAGNTALHSSSGATVTQPSQLGLSELSFNVVSSNNAGNLLTPLDSTVRDTFGGATDYKSTAALNGKLTTAVKDVGDVLQEGTTGTTASATGGGGGDVGDHYGITPLGNTSVSANTAAGVATLQQFTTTQTAFNSLTYFATATGTVTLSPMAITGGTEYWSYNGKTVSSGNSGSIYAATYFTNPGDSLGTNNMGGLPLLVVNITGSPTITTGHALISLSTSVPTSYGATSAGTLTLTGAGHGSYNVAQVTGITNDPAYVEATGWNPVTDKEIYAVDVSLTGTTTLAELVADINNGDTAVGPSSSVMAYASWSEVSSGADPFSSNYNLFLVGNSADYGNPDYLGVDFTSGNDSNLSGVSFSAIAAVPEPMSLGLLAIGGLGLMTRRNRRKA